MNSFTSHLLHPTTHLDKQYRYYHCFIEGENSRRGEVVTCVRTQNVTIRRFCCVTLLTTSFNLIRYIHQLPLRKVNKRSGQGLRIAKKKKKLLDECTVFKTLLIYNLQIIKTYSKCTIQLVLCIVLIQILYKIHGLQIFSPSIWLVFSFFSGVF